MRNNTIESRNTGRNIFRIALGTAIILLIPFFGRWPWTPSDFVTTGVLIFGTGLAYELIVRKTKSTKRQAIVGIALLIVFLIVWADLAVGIFNIPGFSGN